MNNPLCAHCGEPVTGSLVREWTGPAGTPARTWHGDRPDCRGAALPDADDVPDYIAGARALLAASSDCTINGEPAVVVRVAELNDLVARVHRAEAAAPPEPAAILAVVETALNDQLTDTARAEALDGIRRVLAAARTTPDNPVAGSVGTFAEHGPDWDPITGDRTWDEVKDHQFTGLGIDTLVAGLAADATTRHVGTSTIGEPATPGRATVTIAVTAPDQDNADRWAGTIRDLVQAEHGHHMRLDITISGAEAASPEICELPHQTIDEEDDCERRRIAASDDGLLDILDGKAGL